MVTIIECILVATFLVVAVYLWCLGALFYHLFSYVLSFSLFIIFPSFFQGTFGFSSFFCILSLHLFSHVIFLSFRISAPKNGTKFSHFELCSVFPTQYHTLSFSSLSTKRSKIGKWMEVPVSSLYYLSFPFEEKISLNFLIRYPNEKMSSEEKGWRFQEMNIGRNEILKEGYGYIEKNFECPVKRGNEKNSKENWDRNKRELEKRIYLEEFKTPFQCLSSESFQPFGRRCESSISSFPYFPHSILTSIPSIFSEYNLLLPMTPISPFSSRFLSLFFSSLRRRTSFLPDPFLPPPFLPSSIQNSTQKSAKLSILFSGGIDSMLIAIGIHWTLPIGMPIELLNVAFGDSPFEAQDRLTGLSGLKELRHLAPKREWLFVAVDVPWRVLHLALPIVRDLIQPLNTVMDVTIGCALWFAACGIGTLVNGEDASNHSSSLQGLLPHPPSLSSTPCSFRLTHCNVSTQSPCEFSFSSISLASGSSPASSFPHSHLSSSPPFSIWSSLFSLFPQANYWSLSKVVFVGSGADELCAGYSRHRSVFSRFCVWKGAKMIEREEEKGKHHNPAANTPGGTGKRNDRSKRKTRTGKTRIDSQKGYQHVSDELEKDIYRMWRRNLGRDDRIISSHARFVVRWWFYLCRTLRVNMGTWEENRDFHFLTRIWLSGFCRFPSNTSAISVCHVELETRKSFVRLDRSLVSSNSVA